MKHFLIFIFLPILNFAQCFENYTLPSEWQFKLHNANVWHIAKVPGNIYNDLLVSKQISDPYFSSNEKKVNWVDTCSWDYKTEFVIEASRLKKFDHAKITLKGIETFAFVYLNDSMIIYCDNAFRQWQREIYPLLKQGTNTLKIQFRSTVKTAKELASKLPYTLPGDEKVFVRTPQYKFGWDFGPRLIGCSINSPVTIRFWKELDVQTVSFEQLSLTKNEAVLKCKIAIRSTKDQLLSLKITNKTLGKADEYKIQLKKADTLISKEIRISDPKLWWCNGYGEAFQYELQTEIKLPNSESISVSKKVGLRKIELVQKEDPFGKSFYFKLNDVLVFIKGANFIPADIIKDNRKDHEYPLIAKQSKMNMLRVWGGGNYCSDEFYNECDKHGILVWQDLMFACAMYPGDKDFVTNVMTEIKEQVDRLSNRPCLALWCGNNEINEGWKNWGWQKEFNYSRSDSAKIYSDYLELFESKIPALIKQTSLSSIYWPSSPSIGWGHKESLLSGDSHYWGVWWGMQPFENYETKFGRFMSEYGFQSVPNIRTIKSFCETDSIYRFSSALNAHQKHATGFKTIDTYLMRDYQSPDDFDSYIYVSQLLQRDGMRKAIETHRRNMPYCMGTLFWQLNDCWPGISWSSIDYYKRPKAFHYDLQSLYHTLLLSVQKEREAYKVYLISDSIKIITGKLTINLKEFDGTLIETYTVQLNIDPNTSRSYYELNEQIFTNTNKNNLYLHCSFESPNSDLRITQNYFFNKPKDLNLKKPSIKLALANRGKSLIIRSDRFVKDLYIYSPQTDIQLNKNFIDLEPEVNYEIKLSEKLNNLNILKFTSVYDVQHPNDH